MANKTFALSVYSPTKLIWDLVAFETKSVVLYYLMQGIIQVLLWNLGCRYQEDFPFLMWDPKSNGTNPAQKIVQLMAKWFSY